MSMSPSTAAAGSSSAVHNRTPSQVSVPELRLTTEFDSSSDISSSNIASVVGGTSFGSASGDLSGHHGSPNTSSSVPLVYTPPPSSPSSVSRLHLNKVTDPAFWSALHSFLELQFQGTAKEQTPNPNAMSIDPLPMSSTPTHSSQGHGRTPSLSKRAPGESEVQRLWEDFFLSQKRHLSSSEVARVRDETGLSGLAGC